MSSIDAKMTAGVDLSASEEVVPAAPLAPLEAKTTKALAEIRVAATEAEAHFRRWVKLHRQDKGIAEDDLHRRVEAAMNRLFAATDALFQAMKEE